ncbi:hypothetical protein HHO41_13300 [Bacillus sp. DNRA2]|uniref:hypothetical protein n=1 Tax=Bacillus sp. DNRA2 TaxID=2723053 RepID=UPI00145E08B4|nr:hypothetical protein [Bacillus sp. DNRA2]NMD71274.1 hypothetical protein [Bacillus sp. DNRA2]
MVVRELYFDSILYEESTLAHCIYHLLIEKKITLEDDIAKLNMQEADNQIVAELTNNNVLGIVRKAGIFSLKMDQQNFVFIFAKSDSEAIRFYTEMFDKAPLNCHEYSLDFQLTRGRELISFREMRKEFERFPAIAGYFKKE